MTEAELEKRLGTGIFRALQRKYGHEPEAFLAYARQLVEAQGGHAEPVEPLKPEAPAAPAVAPRNQPGPVTLKDNRKYLSERGFFRMSNEFAEELLAIMPTPALRAYIYAHRLARIDGTFYISAGTLAEKIGARSTRHGERVLARLRRAGLIRLIERGSARTKRANSYQLVPLESLDLTTVRSALTEQTTTVPVAELATA